MNYCKSDLTSIKWSPLETVRAHLFRGPTCYFIITMMMMMMMRIYFFGLLSCYYRFEFGGTL